MSWKISVQLSLKITVVAQLQIPQHFGVEMAWQQTGNKPLPKINSMVNMCCVIIHFEIMPSHLQMKCFTKYQNCSHTVHPMK